MLSRLAGVEYTTDPIAALVQLADMTDLNAAKVRKTVPLKGDSFDLLPKSAQVDPMGSVADPHKTIILNRKLLIPRGSPHLKRFPLSAIVTKMSIAS